MRRLFSGGAVLLLAGTLLAHTARADAPHRPVPDYDGRAPRSADAVDALLWVPRIATGPMYLAWEYCLRQPHALLATFIERNHLVPLVYSVLTVGTEQNIVVLPTAFFDFGFLASAGLYAFWNDLGAPGHRVSVYAATGGDDWLSLSIHDRAKLDPYVTIFVRAHALRRPDYLLGIDSGNDVRQRARYGAETLDAEAGWEVRVSHRSSLTFSGRVASTSFHDTLFEREEQPSVPLYAVQHGTSLPVGFARGYALGALRLGAVFDSRDPRGLPSSGVRIEGRAELAGTFDGMPGSRWVRLDGEALAAIDALGGHRVLSLAIDASVIEPIDGSPIPFDQEIDAGGLGPLAAFGPGYLRGRSALAVTLAYEWPIWVFLEARVHVAIGNAFGPDFDRLAPEHLRLSFGLAVRPIEQGDHPFEMGFALGTDPIDVGANVSTARIYLGARNLL